LTRQRSAVLNDCDQVRSVYVPDYGQSSAVSAGELRRPHLACLSWRLAAALRIGAGGATQMTPVSTHQLLSTPASVIFWDRAA
jgi:hypothetical protein